MHVLTVAACMPYTETLAHQQLGFQNLAGLAIAPHRRGMQMDAFYAIKTAAKPGTSLGWTVLSSSDWWRLMCTCRCHFNAYITIANDVCEMHTGV
jgi:hypothetical protein